MAQSLELYIWRNTEMWADFTMAYSILGTEKVLQPATVVALGLPILRARGLQAVTAHRLLLEEVFPIR
jgi:hypothetical protein